ncbi:hypothetical protein [Novosphingobium pokkalii]|uniref:Uncharacterized protein n=1 Tax=Novosphingobium pokkalii TaxID=1770194 RepID=A0ABV7V189_9SPHN|nr:hypothetical protein [Novosphingobium pokkalii]GHC82842.1 hypothetical protein GCM10019060_01820 [Novosphingobium pokkalii]
MIRATAATLALGALLSAQAAQAATPPACLESAEVNAMVTYALPAVMDSAMTFCAPHLAPQGFFAREGQGLVQRYAQAKPAAWPRAKAALLKLAQTDKDPTIAQMARLPDKALQPFADGMLGQIVTEGLKPETCGPLEQMTRLLAPLPPENTAGLFTLIIRMVETLSRKPGAQPRKSGLPLCPDTL